MSGVQYPINFDSRHCAKHLLNTPQSSRLLRLGRAIHVFKDQETLFWVAQVIIDRGEYLGFIRNYERYGLLFEEVIGYRISPDHSQIPLFYGEIKIDANNRYHPIPRTKPSRE